MLSEYKGEFQHRFRSKCYTVDKLYLPKFTSKKKSGGYSDYCYSRKESIERK